MIVQKLQVDYSEEAHDEDYARYFERFRYFSCSSSASPETASLASESSTATTRPMRRRARAMMDFERREDDELGFRKNDIITVRLFAYCLCSSNYNHSQHITVFG